ncbi:MAG: PAS domain S-box protein [Planctomycetota bacterium]|nr:MAG: PAS domain S-box protein [Planctomycetota bacterium]
MELDYQKDPSLLARVVDLLPVGFFTVDAEGRIVSWNRGAQRITGYSATEVVGRPCTLLEGDNCKGFAKLRDLLQHPELCPPDDACQQECKLLARDGTERYVHGSVRILREADGRIAGAVGCFIDLTDFVRANERVSLLEEQVKRRESFGKLIGRSVIMQEVFRRLRLAAQSDVTVFLSGESGTGKELAATAVHSLSNRRDRPFIAVNCSAIPETLLESELFGHVRGAFTGAVRDKIGMFQAADGGTLFLDEIGDLSPHLQLKLLRVLQERQIRRVGDERPIPIDVRLITATHRDLTELIREGRFREDFYYRIHVFEIHMPALRERREDIPLLVEHFMREFSETYGKPIRSLARDALQRLMEYHWPGNVRQLRNAIEHAFVVAQGSAITLFDLPPEIRTPSALSPTSPGAGNRARTAAASRATAPASRPFTAQETEERERIRAALQRTGGNKTAAARLLGISRVTMWKKCRKYGL